jgi:hypothetical protein
MMRRRQRGEQEPMKPWAKWFLASILVQAACSLLGMLLLRVAALDVVPQLSAVGVPTLLWLYRIQRVRALRRAQRVKYWSLEALYGGLLLSAAPLPAFLFYRDMVLFGVRLADWVAWGWFGGWVALVVVMGALLQALAAWLLERDALAKDLSEDRVALPGGRVARSARDIGVWRKVQWALCALGVVVVWVTSMMVDRRAGVTPALALQVGGALCLLMGGGLVACQRKRVNRPQRGALFSPWLSLLDILIPWFVVMCLACFVAAMFLDERDWPELGLVFVCIGGTLGIISQAPALVIKRDRQRWRAAWAVDNAAPLTALSQEARVGLALDVDGWLQMDDGAAGESAPPLRAVTPQAPRLYTGDPVFDGRFEVPHVSGRVLGALNAQTRAAALALYDFGLSVEVAEGGWVTARCQTLHPWQVQVAAQRLVHLARAWEPERSPHWLTLAAAGQAAARDATPLAERRLLSGALSDPVPTTQCLCAQALIDAWQRQGVLWPKLREQVATDAPSQALLRALRALERRDAGASDDMLGALAVDAPWPTVGDVFAQALWVAALDLLDEAAARAALSPPRGRLARLPVHFAVRVAAKAAAVAATADDWALEALAQAQYAEHQVALCQSLALFGTVQSVTPLRALARDEAASVMTRDAALAAADTITRRLHLCDLAGGLALPDAPSDSGALSIASDRT